ncbi:ABC transporter ATP-binding protein [Geomonas oryzisoli]|uniref:ABC transporter ATP-binding protein n=1 Tax=Geomonas oryzisoli TaxID=2847992 RepID=A0ABX8J280_9BACT|nr:ABC transporter ATP-binding protein [Geomonas oryzisoli]QWV92455.1 ABC transporter ATP-binding protein [Geomonas oryzisoli]
MPNAAIKLQDISKTYKLYDSQLHRLKEALNPLRKKYHHIFYAINGVSITINKGEVIGIIGKNGSGKSTLLKIITGVLTPTTGTVEVQGKVSALLELGAGFNPELTGLENIYFNGTLTGQSKEEIDQNLDQILSFADIGDFIHQPVKNYSSGMFVRLAFAVAINVAPDILIVDEALSVGDIRFQRKCFSVIDNLRSNGKTILFVSHALETVNTFCNRAILIDDGRILEQGPPKLITRLFQKMMLGEHFAGDSLAKYNSNEGATKALNNDRKAIIALAQAKLNINTTGKKAEIIDYGIVDSSGQKVTALRSGEKYTIYSRVLIHQDLDKIHLGYPIKNVQGLMLFGVNSYIKRLKISPQQAGNVIEGRVAVTMWLAPGNYFLSFRAGHIDETYDELADAVHFVVTGDCEVLPGSVVNLDAKMDIANIL